MKYSKIVIILIFPLLLQLLLLSYSSSAYSQDFSIDNNSTIGMTDTDIAEETEESEEPVEAGAKEEETEESEEPVEAVSKPDSHIAIEKKFNDLIDNKGFSGKPKTPITQTPDGVGYFQYYQDNNGKEWAIYWTSKTGAHEVHGDILKKWASLNWEKGVLKYPESDEKDLPGITGGKYNQFQNGYLVWSPGKDVKPIKDLANAVKVLNSLESSSTTVLKSTVESKQESQKSNPIKYKIKINSFYIYATMSPDQDTDYVTLGVSSGNNKPISKTVFVGDRDDGYEHPLTPSSGGEPSDTLEIPVSVNSNDKLNIVYSIVNKHGDSNIGTIKKLSTAAAGVLGVPALAKAIDTIGGYIEKYKLLPGNCDGLIMEGELSFTSSQIAKLTSKGPYKKTIDSLDVKHEGEKGGICNVSHGVHHYDMKLTISRIK